MTFVAIATLRVNENVQLLIDSETATNIVPYFFFFKFRGGYLLNLCNNNDQTLLL